MGPSLPSINPLSQRAREADRERQLLPAEAQVSTCLQRALPTQIKAEPFPPQRKACNPLFTLPLCD